ncbi:MAG: HNH endonuclease [Candidatus Symbiothrix sp.]|jgi:hypothetical protein|nr:HNH endonuclease [Candidatus Symbiothrix sp.]
MEEVSIGILEKLFNDFSAFVSTEDKQPFKTFKNSKYIDNRENYKYSVFEEAKKNLASKWWNDADIGTGKIQAKVTSAVKARVHHSSQWVNNNLINWRQVDDFSKMAVVQSLEKTLYNFYRNKIKPNEAFEQFMSEGLSYQFIAYLFFIKEKDQFMPISQDRFDKTFSELLGLDFKTSNNVSWDNYDTYNKILKQVYKFLKGKGTQATLLDAHSFLWILWEIYNPEKQENPIPKVDTTSKTVEKELEKPKHIDIDENHSFQLEADEKEELAHDINPIESATNLTNEEKKALIKIRIGQSSYRAKLIEYWQGCSIHGYKNSDLLIASHIKPYSDCNINEKYDLYNGLLLTPNYDKLFDKYYISFDEDGKIMFSVILKQEDLEMLGLLNTDSIIKEKLKPQHLAYLKQHNQKFIQLENERQEKN